MKNDIKIKAIPDHSSTIESLAYNGSDSTLLIEFSTGDKYEYYNVPRSVAAQVLGANSMGKAFHNWVKDSYEFCRA